MAQRRISKDRDEEEQELPTPAGSVKDEELVTSTDDLLDEIDELLGEVGEEFALEYKQAGGQ